MSASLLSMALVAIPDLACPFPTALNPSAEQVESNAIAWGRRIGLLTETHVIQRVEATKATWLMAWAYPDAAPDALQIIADWNLWLLIWDDRCSEPDLRDRPTVLAPLHARFLDVLDGAALTSQDGPLEHGLHELQQRLRRQTRGTWMRQFLHSVRAVFDGWVWEAANRAIGVYLDVADYLRMRPITGALQPYLDLVAVADGRSIPHSVQAHSSIKQLTLMANNIICWSNDLFSLNKELQQGEPLNLVLILHQQQGGSLQDAIDRVAAWHDMEVAAFLDLAARLPAFGAQQRECDRYVALLRHWMRANMNWATVSGRYQPQQCASVCNDRSDEVGGWNAPTPDDDPLNDT